MLFWIECGESFVVYFYFLCYCVVIFLEVNFDELVDKIEVLFKFLVEVVGVFEVDFVLC